MQENIIPQHIAIIPDGNRRWGKAHGIIPHQGIAEGAKRFHDMCDAGFEIGVKYLTFWAASEDNFTKRGPAEVAFMTSLLKEEGKKNVLLEKLIKNEAKIRWIGKWREILKDKGVEEVIDRWEESTKNFTKHQVTLLYGYDGRTEMLEAIKKMKNIPTDQCTYETVKNALWTGDLPMVDFVIRTGGEPHWSAGFMMWLTTDSQFYFTDLLWPDFNKEELKKALEEYARRERRYGK